MVEGLININNLKENNMAKSVISTEKAPAAVGPYSQAVKTGNLVLTSGQIGLDPATGKMVEGGVVPQAKMVLDNLAAVLEAAGSGMDSILKCTIFLADMGDFAAVNEIYKDRFSGDFPARSCVAVKQLPLGALLEIEAIAEA